MKCSARGSIIGDLWIADAKARKLPRTSLAACSTNNGNDVIKLSPRDYLDQAVQVIQNRTLKSPSVDWVGAKIKSTEMIAGAKSTVETYPAINYVLSQLGDNHSFLKARNGGATTFFPRLQFRIS